MAKKPELTVVGQPAATPSSPPANLGEAGTKLWQALQKEYRIDDAGGCEMLLQICLAADRAEECAAVIAADGPTIRTKAAGIRDHPLLKHELAARSFIVRSLHRLGLDIEPKRDGPGRPPGTFTRG
jgi:hypothetical protein